MTPTIDTLAEQWGSWGNGLIFGLLCLIAILFVVRFVLPALRLAFVLDRAIQGLKALKDQGGVAPGEIARTVMLSPGLAHLWSEYTQTLHAATDGRGGEAKKTWRATAMAQDFFNERALVETPLKTDFYRHLPGILTGIGIIGTFGGLISGLAHFEVSNNAEAVRNSLRVLIQGVGHAFVVSAVAITLAMVVTWLEKTMITRCNRRVNQLVQLIDSLFDAGVGEEYLARLVRASEQSVAQAAAFQKAVVLELRESLDVLMKRQLDLSRSQQAEFSGQLAATVGERVGVAIQKPLNDIIQALDRLGGSQEDRLSNALGGALAGHTRQWDAIAAKRQEAWESVLQRTAAALERAVAELSRVAVQFEAASHKTLDTVSSRVARVGEETVGAVSGLGVASREISAVSTQLQQVAAVLGGAMGDYRHAIGGMAQLVADLQSTVGLAKREAAITGELVSRMEAAAAVLGKATRESEVFLDGVGRVIGEAHGAFAENVERTLSRQNNQFQLQLANALEAMSGAVEELSDAAAMINGKQQ